MPSAPERRRPRKATFLALAALASTGAIALACGIDAVATRDGPVVGADTSTADRVVVLPPEGGPVPDATPDAVVEAEAGCPTGHGTMVEVHDAGGLTFCIDSTEVTNAEFQKFVDAVGAPDSGFDAGSANGCAPGGPFTFTFSPPGASEFPASFLTWCSARAYCGWAGKRLCGKTNGTDAAAGEWYQACSNGGTRPYPYGSTARPPGTCDDNTPSPTATGSHPQCEGGVPGLFDMVGNVTEWTDSCQGGQCAAAGGFYNGGGTCATVNVVARDTAADSVGFRCCSDL